MLCQYLYLEMPSLPIYGMLSDAADSYELTNYYHPDRPLQAMFTQSTRLG